MTRANRSDDLRRTLDRVAAAHAKQDPKTWAWRLKAREEQGERLSKVQRDFWREALRAELATERTEA